MMKRISLILLLISLTYYSKTNAQDTTWTKTFGGSSNDRGYSVQQTTDGGYVIGGYTSSYGNGSADVWLIKTDADGDTLWTQTYGGSSNDRGYSVQQTTDGGYIIAGYTESFGNGDDDVWLIKTDSNGDSLWTKTFGGSDGDYGYSVQQTTDGGYIITCTEYSYGMDSNIWLIKTDSLGQEEWNQIFYYVGNSEGRSVQQTTDGGYIIAGMYSYLAILIKTDSLGNEEWHTSYFPSGSSSSWGSCVQQTIDNGFIFTGYSFMYDVWTTDVLLIKTDSLGNEEWNQTFGGNEDDYGSSVQQTTDGGYIITGITTSFGNGGQDMWLIKTDADGDDEWNQTFGGSNNDEGHSVQETTDGRYVITGSTASFGYGGEDVWLIKTDSDAVVEIASTFNLPATYNIHQNYPNPFNPITTLRYDLPENSYVNVTVYDILGREVRTLVNSTQDAGFKSVIWNATNDYGEPVSAGVYLYQIQAGEFVQTKKMVLLK